MSKEPNTGHWIIEREPNTNKIMSYHCSECYERTGHFVTSADNYCPECGTRMHLQPIEDMTGDEWVDDVVESMKGETFHTIIPQEEMDALLSGLGGMYEPYKESEDKAESEGI